ncbi:hypothetical protein EHS25_000888 [Saitozyma podzolica]|uniref:Uncharacterized protein n=1 Tax=Saitozyma podzolica TaxID=1890683 RepID=A0A427YXI8_9TREE|nr:hypothetical protein EHS25_000888 [Saitozyma podzolica]
MGELQLTDLENVLKTIRSREFDLESNLDRFRTGRLEQDWGAQSDGQGMMRPARNRGAGVGLEGLESSDGVLCRYLTITGN